MAAKALKRDKNKLLKLLGPIDPGEQLDEESILELVKKTPKLCFTRLENQHVLHRMVYRNASFPAVQTVYDIYPQAVQEKSSKGTIGYPLHFAIWATRHKHYETTKIQRQVVQFLMAKFPQALQEQCHIENPIRDCSQALPLHLAIYHKVELEIITDLLQGFPEAISYAI